MPDEDKPKELKMTLRFTPQLHARVKAIADKEHRSLHGQVIRFLEEGAGTWLKEHRQESEVLQ